ncbi:MAG: hypothetical protein RR446_08260, partial [Lachnospiraceae bacterium]
KQGMNSQVIQTHGHTFIIQIKNNENKSWQGTVEWTQTHQTIPFRSALELIKLLDSAVSTEVMEIKE